jgi:hypothetical protein
MTAKVERYKASFTDQVSSIFRFSIEGATIEAFIAPTLLQAFNTTTASLSVQVWLTPRAPALSLHSISRRGR